MNICIYSSYAWIKIANNYGSILQYFALQTYLKSKGIKFTGCASSQKKKLH